MRKIIGFILILISIVTMSACSVPNEIADKDSDVINTEESYNREMINKLLGEGINNVREETIIIPNVEKEYRFLYIADLHIIAESDEIAEKDIETVKNRYEMFANSNGIKSEQVYKELIENVNKTDLDGILMGGDMIDYLSKANWDLFKDGLDTLSKPYLFATADHDVSAWWTNYTKKEKKILKENMEIDLVDFLEYDEFIILSIGESTSQISKKALAQIEEVFEIGKPIIIVTHVPYESLLDSGLAEMSKQFWGDRVLLWGEDTNYVPNKTTQKFIDMLHAEDTPVVAVLAGHLHFEYVGMLNKNVKQYVFNPAYSGEVVLFTIKSSE